MEFDKSRVFSSVNADELKAGDKVIVADCIKTLKRWVESGSDAVVCELQMVVDESYEYRFVTYKGEYYALAYLVERAENCTNCGSHEVCGYVQNISKFACFNRCENYTPKTEKKYRPFKDCDELCKVWCEKHKSVSPRPKGTMPLIWVRNKEDKRVWLITEFDNRLLDYLFTNCEFLDGSVCGVEE